MTTYRILNNIHAYHQAFVDFKKMRGQFHGLKVWFSQKNEPLLDRLKDEWSPVSVTFESDKKSNQTPDISVWNYSCLVLSEKAFKVFEPLLSEKGEILELNDGYVLFNCLDSIGGDAIDQAKSRFDIEAQDSAHIPKELSLLPHKLEGRIVFKPGFSHNSFLLCSEKFKSLADQNKLGGVSFETNLAKMFL